MSELIIINSDHFYEALNRDSKINGYRVFDVIEIKGLKTTSKAYTISNLVFNDEVIITLDNEFIVFNFINVEFQKGLKITNTKLYTLSFNNCKFDSLQFSHSNINNKLELFNKSEISNFFIVESQLNEVRINQCTLTKFDAIKKSSFLGRFEIVDSKITGQPRIENVKFKELVFERVNNSDSFYFWFCAFSNALYIKEASFKNSLKLDACKGEKLFINKSNIDHLWVRNSKNQKNGLIRNIFDSITIKNSQFENKCIIEDLYNREKQLSCYNFSLIFGSNSKGEINTYNFNIDQMIMDGNNYYTDIKFENTNITHVNFESFNNNKTLSFFNLNPYDLNSSFQIHKSNLGSTQLYYCKLSDYDIIEIKQSNIVDIIAIGVNWFTYKSIIKSIKWVKISFKEKLKFLYKPLYLKLSNNSRNIDEYQDLRELFRQLKLVMEKQGNKIQALQFKQYEMKAYKRELQLTKRCWDIERMILFANQSNSHGQNWFKPILLGVGFTILFLWLIVFSSSPELTFTLSFNPDDIKYTFNLFWGNLKYFPSFMNPVFNLKDILEKQNFEFVFGSYFWALIQRISIAFFIYQTVTAFRKYGSK